MPDDTVFEPKPNGGEKTPEPDGGTPTPVGVTADEVATQLKEGLGPIQKSVEEFNQFLAGLKEQAAAPPVTPDPNTEDWATKFYGEPQKTVQDEIASQTAPALTQAASTMGKMLLDTQKAAIDAEFGAGAWDEVFEGRLAPIVADAAKTNPMSLMSPTAVQNAVNTIKGDNFADLAQRALKAAEVDSDPNKEIVDAVTSKVVEMTGGIRRIPGAQEDKLDDEESQEFLKTHFKQTGEELDPQRLAKVMNLTGSTYDEWKKATASKEGK